MVLRAQPSPRGLVPICGLSGSQELGRGQSIQFDWKWTSKWILIQHGTVWLKTTSLHTGFLTKPLPSRILSFEEFYFSAMQQVESRRGFLYDFGCVEILIQVTSSPASHSFTKSRCSLELDTADSSVCVALFTRKGRSTQWSFLKALVDQGEVHGMQSEGPNSQTNKFHAPANFVRSGKPVKILCQWIGQETRWTNKMTVPVQLCMSSFWWSSGSGVSGPDNDRTIFPTSLCGPKSSGPHNDWSLSSPRWSLSGPEISGPEKVVVWSWSLFGPVTPELMLIVSERSQNASEIFLENKPRLRLCWEQVLWSRKIKVDQSKHLTMSPSAFRPYCFRWMFARQKLQRQLKMTCCSRNESSASEIIDTHGMFST